jgi:hypothetical protein
MSGKLCIFIFLFAFIFFYDPGSRLNNGTLIWNERGKTCSLKNNKQVSIFSTSCIKNLTDQKNLQMVTAHQNNDKNSSRLIES